jgi:dienelactone hydrolase
MTGDVPVQMVAGIATFLDNRLAAAAATHSETWQPDFSSLAAYQSSLEPQRQWLARALGVVDQRVDAPTMIGLDDPSALVAETSSYRVYAVSWPVLEGVTGEGLLLEPKTVPVATVVALPDADWTPEMLTGLASGVPSPAQFARRLAENGCQVLVPVLLDRSSAGSGNSELGIGTNESHREFIYRMAYQMGRTIQGYEIEKVLSAIDWLTQSVSGLPIGVFGYGEGSLLALYTAALDPRVSAVVVSGMSGPLEDMWAEPLYRNVGGLLRDAGLPQLAELVAPGTLIIECSAGPAVASTGGQGAAAPGRLLAQDSLQLLAEFQAELLPSRDQLDQVSQLIGRPWLILNADSTLPGSTSTLTQLLTALTGTAVSLQPDGAAGQDLRQAFDAVARQQSQFTELQGFTQTLVANSEALRQQSFWSQLDYSSLANYRAAIAPFREQLWDEVIGRLPASTVDMNPQTRLLYDEPRWKGYEVMLSIYPGVFAYGYLLVPKDLMEGERRPVVVCQHGVDVLAVEAFNPRYSTFMHHSFGAQLADRGYVVFVPQNPYVGDESFRILQRKANPLGLSLMSFIITQQERILEFLVGLPFVDPDDIASYGLSYGGRTALYAAAVLDGFSLCITSGNFTDWIWKTTTSDFGGSYLFSPDYDVFDFNLGGTFNHAEMAALVAPRPFMVERGQSDATSPEAKVVYQYDIVEQLYAQLGLLDSTAMDLFEGGHEIHGVGTFAFLDAHLW